MVFWQWTAQNWFNVFSALGIIASLWFTAASFRAGAKTQRITNFLTITANHREIWKELSRNPSLNRILDASSDPIEKPPTDEEQMLVSMVISHISAVYYATQDGLTVKFEGLQQDVSEFFSLPIPRSIWEKTKVVQNDDFVAFVESCRRGK